MLAEGHYDQVVSLGRGCQPAHQIRRADPDAVSHVFDWIVTTDVGLVELIATDLDGFFSRDRLGMGPENCIIDRATRTQFLHEFPEGEAFEVQFEKNAGRYAMLAERWRSLLASEASVLFVRQHGWDVDVRASAIRLREAIAAKAPRLRFSLLYLTAAEEDAWDETSIVNRFLRQPTPYVWTGDNAAWERVLGEGLAQPPHAQRALSLEPGQ